jgi:hypothetical protein
VLRVRLPADLFDHLGEISSARIVIGHIFYPAVRLTGGAPVATVVRDPVERAISVWEYLNWQTHHPDHAWLKEWGVETIEEMIAWDPLTGHLADRQTRLLGVEYDLEGIVAALQGGEIDAGEARRLAADAEATPADEAMLGRAKRRLQEMVAVGVTEALPEFASRVERHLGLQGGRAIAHENATPTETVARRDQAYDAEIRRKLTRINRFDCELHSFARKLSERN